MFFFLDLLLFVFYRWHLAAIVRRDRLECSIGESSSQDEREGEMFLADASAVTVLSFRC